MSTGTDFLANLQKKTVKNTVQQKQQKRVNASAVDVSALLEAALGKKKPVEAVADVRQSTDAATASFLPLADTHQGRSTQQKPKNASDKKQTPQKSKDIVDAGITALIQKALDAKKVMAEPDIAERLQSSMESEFTKLFTPEEPQENKFVSTATFRATKKKAGTLNVAAYIRVSTDMSDQENSYETQEKYFNQLIENNPVWNAVGVYSDYGISGTSKEKRTGFRRLMRHCKDGKIDRIVCKSISRFARNTADFMSALDVLHDCGVTILFEKENLDTADPTSDFILTTLAAIAQEESRSISSNIRLGQKMRFPKGDVPNKIMYGYRYNGKMVTSESGYEYKDIEIVEEEARVVRRIFHEVVEGKAYTEIARGLNMDKIPAPVTDAVRVRKKKSKKGQLNSDLLDGWTGGNITRIVRAERYMGAVLIQKKFTSDYLTHEVRDNKGEVPQYFVRNHHPAIVDEDLFEKAQEVVKVNSDLYNRTRSGKKPRAFSQRLICGECGRFFHVTNGNGNYPIWRCPTSSRTTGKRICHAEKVYEEQVVRAFRKAVLERFRLTLKPIHDNVAVADIMSGRFKEQYDNIRVAAYCRVSTGDESQQTSYTTQKAFYKDLITRKPGWIFAGIYADEAKSGTNREHREEFNRMIKDAMDGKLDYIVTKSISRFARNTIDSLTCTRELRQLKPPVGIYFEKENIDTLDAKGELILTILSALAQDESRSISDNIRWSIQKKFQSGVPHINLKRMLGYELGANKQWVIVPEQAEIIRYIFDRFVKGQTANKIALELNQMEKFTVNGKKWSAGSILIVLRNEKYVGDIEMQKTITKDFLTHRSSINKGEAPRYYVKNHHVGIIDRVTWDKVQTMLFEKPRADMTKGPGKKKVKSIKGSPFGNLRCGAILENGPDAGKPCGEGFFRTTYTGVANGYSDERSLKATGEDTGEYLEKYTYSYPVWRCKRKVGERDGEPPKNGSPDQKAYCRSKKGCMSDEEKEAANKRCPSERYHECALEQSFMELLYSMKRDFEQHGDASMIVAMFDNAYEQAVRLANNNSISVQRMATVENQIKEMEERLQDAISHQVAALREAALEQNVELNEALSNGEVTIDDIDLDIRSGLTPGSIGVSFYGTETEEGSEAQIYTELVNDLQERLKTLQQERQTIEEEQGVLAIMKKNFEYFLACLKELPDTNAGGMPLRVNGLDVQGTLLRDVDGNAIEGRKRAITSGKLKLTPERIAEAPDMLHFEKGIYCAFVESGVLQGDVATYKTNFGVTLTSKGNRRTLDSFMGYKRSDMDGNVVYVDAPYKVYGFSIQYRRYLTTAAKREREEAV